MPDLSPELEAALAGMTDGEFAALTAKVRAPDSTEALRTAAAQIMSGPALEAFVSTADVSKFAGQDGTIDASRVLSTIKAAYGITGQQQQQANHGQHSGGMAPKLRPGDRGRLEAARRYGTPIDPETAAAAGTIGRGAAGKAAAARRFPQQQKDAQ